MEKKSSKKGRQIKGKDWGGWRVKPKPPEKNLLLHSRGEHLAGGGEGLKGNGDQQEGCKNLELPVLKCLLQSNVYFGLRSEAE